MANKKTITRRSKSTARKGSTIRNGKPTTRPPRPKRKGK